MELRVVPDRLAAPGQNQRDVMSSEALEKCGNFHEPKVEKSSRRNDTDFPPPSRGRRFTASGRPRQMTLVVNCPPGRSHRRRPFATAGTAAHAEAGFPAPVTAVRCLPWRWVTA
ncbi:hypothetical protein GCM10022224_043950 [Nonomuraea antimicrobica]|uniref:Uncharacterized protein n=1 Tax=Nonomuraea antimicrobica TaxID=561173 RepID=A0ABP7BZY2_9ACTN